MTGFRSGIAAMTMTTLAAVAANRALTAHEFRIRRPGLMGRPETFDLRSAA